MAFGLPSAAQALSRAGIEGNRVQAAASRRMEGAFRRRDAKVRKIELLTIKE
jgi:hypothetical protein